MTEQTGGGQPPAGWYPDGSGQVRYWDGATWTEHVQPAQPEAPAPQQPTGPAEPAVPASAAAPAAATPAAADTGYAAAPADQPFYRKPAGLAVIGVVLLLVLGGLAFALASGGDDDGGGTVATPGGVATSAAPSAAPTTATQSYTLNCEPFSKIEGSNAAYPFALTLTVTPTEVSLSSDASIKNTGPSTIEVDQYRFEAAVTVNGTPLQLVGPSNKAEVKGDPTKEEIFKTAERPMVAKAPLPAGTAGTPTVVLTDLYFNNINNPPNGSDKITDIFDSRCNASPQPNSAPAPIGLSVPPGAGGAPASVAPSVASSVTP